MFPGFPCFREAAMPKRVFTPEHRAHLTEAQRRRWAGLPHESRHGTPSEYVNHKCRCAECKRAWANYNRERMQARRREGVKA
jgi:hypothetical protein